MRFEWEGSLYEFLCLWFGLGSAPWLFTKFIKVRVSILHKVCIRIIVYLDDFLIAGDTFHETILILIRLGFLRVVFY